MEKKLIQTAELINKLKHDLNKLSKHGFKKEIDFISSSPHLYINRKTKVVVKLPLLTTNAVKRGKYFLQTLFVKYKGPEIDTRYGAISKYIFIQPFIERTKTEKAVEILDKKIKVSVDLSEGNVGWYKNKPVLFDW